MNIARLAADTNSTSGGAAYAQLLIFAVIGLVMYFLMIRPQRRRQREAVAMQRAIEVGDEIVTSSGIYGIVTELDGDVAFIDIDSHSDVQIKISRAALSRKVTTDGAARDAKAAGGDAKAAGSDA